MTGTGIVSDPYIILTRVDLEAVNDHLDAYYELGADINLAGSNWTPLGWSSPYDPYSTTEFSGELDGKGHRISGMTITMDADALAVAEELFDIGLFGIVSGTVKNLALCSFAIALDVGTGANAIQGIGGLAGECSGTLTAVTISGSMTFTGGNVEANAFCRWIGGLAGSLTGTATSCYVNLAITDSSTGALSVTGCAVGRLAGTVTACEVKGTITGTFSGGLVGGAIGEIIWSGTISTSRCTASLATGPGSGTSGSYGGFMGRNSGSVSQCQATGDVTIAGSASAVGGFVGECDGTIADSLALGDASGDENIGGFVGQDGGGGASAICTNCYSIGTPSGTSGVGGFCGYSASRTASSCYWDTQTSGQATSALGTGKTTAQMQTQSTFTGWDFSTVWNIASGTYPFLRTAFVTIRDWCKKASNAIWFVNSI